MKNNLTNKEIQEVDKTIRIASQYNLVAEVMTFALYNIKKDNHLTLEAALTMALLEWDLV